jgi:hypothetical protein
MSGTLCGGFGWLRSKGYLKLSFAYVRTGCACIACFWLQLMTLTFTGIYHEEDSVVAKDERESVAGQVLLTARQRLRKYSPILRHINLI